MTNTAGNRAVLLGRKSQVRVEADAVTIESQFDDTGDYCQRQNPPLEVVAKLKDEESGYSKTAKREGLREALDMIQTGKAQHLVVARLDRLTRQGPLAFLTILDNIEKWGGTLHIIEYNIKGDTAMGRGQLALLAAVAEEWAERTSNNIKRANLKSAAEGRRHGGRRPYGWHMSPKSGPVPCPSCGGEMAQEEVRGRLRAVVELCPVEAEVVREVARRIAAGETVSRVVADLNKRGVGTASGTAWAASTVIRVLRSPALVGNRTHLGVEHDGAFPPILTPEEQASALAGIKGVGGVKLTQSLLSGMRLLFCECGAGMIAANSSSRAPRYRCGGFQQGYTGCGKVTAVQGRVDEAVIGAALAGLKVWRNQHRSGGGGIQTWEAELTQDEEALKALTADCYLNRDHPLYGNNKAFRDAAVPLNERISKLRDLIAAAAPVVMAEVEPDGPIEEWWDAKSLGEKRAILSHYLKRVEVRGAAGRGRTFDPTRVKVEWRQDKFWKEVGPALAETELTLEEHEVAYRHELGLTPEEYEEAYRQASEE